LDIERYKPSAGVEKVFGQLKVLGGDYAEASFQEDWWGRPYFQLTPKKEGFWATTIKKRPHDISSIEEVTEENKMRIGRKLGLSLAGGILFGPVGAIAGAVFGGRGKDVVFLCTFKDGTKVLAVASEKLYKKIIKSWHITRL